MNEYDIQENWISTDDALPQSGERCLVTDGEVLDIATHVKESDGDKTYWVCGNLKGNDRTFNIIGWMKLPKPMKVKAKMPAYVEKTPEKN